MSGGTSLAGIRTPKASRNLSQNPSSSAFFDSQGTVRTEFVPQRQTVNHFHCYTVQQTWIYKLLNQLFALVSICSKIFLRFKTFTLI